MSASGATGYQWYSGSTSGSGTPISGAISATYSATVGSYWCKVNYSSGCSTNSGVATVTAYTAPAITGPASQAVCPGGSASLSVSASGATGYQWFSGSTSGSGTPISGAISATYSATVGSYWCRVNYGSGCSTNSSVASVTNAPTPSVTIDPTSVALCPGWNSTLMLTVSGGSGFQYQWYRGNPGTGTEISGAMASNYPTATAGTYYCRVTNSNGCWVYSPVSTVTSYAATVISAQPSNKTVCLGDNAIFTCAATGPGAITYQWYQIAGGVSYKLGTGSSLTISTAPGPGSPTPPYTNQYYCVATSSTCNQTAQTNTVTLSVNPNPQAPSITQFGQNDHTWAQLDSPDGNCIWYRYSYDYGNTWSIWQNDGDCWTHFWPYVGPTGYPSGAIVVQAKEINAYGCESSVTERAYTY